MPNKVVKVLLGKVLSPATAAPSALAELSTRVCTLTDWLRLTADAVQSRKSTYVMVDLIFPALGRLLFSLTDRSDLLLLHSNSDQMAWRVVLVEYASQNGRCTWKCIVYFSHNHLRRHICLHPVYLPSDMYSTEDVLPLREPPSGWILSRICLTVRKRARDTNIVYNITSTVRMPYVLFEDLNRVLLSSHASSGQRGLSPSQSTRPHRGASARMLQLPADTV